jgi:hypothetical protein
MLDIGVGCVTLQFIFEWRRVQEVPREERGCLCERFSSVYLPVVAKAYGREEFVTMKEGNVPIL